MSGIHCTNCDATDLGCTACGALGTLATHPTDADRLAAVLALCEERNDYGVLSISQVRAAAGGAA